MLSLAAPQRDEHALQLRLRARRLCSVKDATRKQLGQRCHSEAGVPAAFARVGGAPQQAPRCPRRWPLAELLAARTPSIMKPVVSKCRYKVQTVYISTHFIVYTSYLNTLHFKQFISLHNSLGIVQTVHRHCCGTPPPIYCPQVAREVEAEP